MSIVKSPNNQSDIHCTVNANIESFEIEEPADGNTTNRLDNQTINNKLNDEQVCIR
jgi:hypothetical protein